MNAWLPDEPEAEVRDLTRMGHADPLELDGGSSRACEELNASPRRVGLRCTKISRPLRTTPPS
jgi:hypothetical protein